MRTRSSLSVLLFSLLVGCTSLLGDFEVGGGPGGCGDVQTDRNNCGTCGNVCAAGLSCTAGVCGCAADEALCGGACTKASRTACGPTCTACQDDEVCSSGCVPAPDPDFTRRPEPFGTTGWSSGGGPLELEVKTLSVPGIIYECRSGPVVTSDPANPPWGNCDGASGSGTVHRPKEDPANPEGTYFTEHRYRSDTYRSKTVRTEYYVHHSLDMAQRCPRAGVANDVPRLTDQQYFDAANLYAASNQIAFPTSIQFPPEGADKNADMFLHPPFISIRFQAVQVSGSMASTDLWTFVPMIGWPLANQNYDLNERTLRHKYVLNMNRSLLLYKRVWTHPKRNDCVDSYVIGNNLSRMFGPTDGARGVKKVNCEAFVMNSRGNALCLRTKMDGTGAETVPVDAVPAPRNNGVGTLAVVINNPTVTLTGGNLSGSAGYYIQIPLQTAPGNPGRWYRIQSATFNPGPGTYTVVLSEPYQGPTAAAVTYGYAGTTSLTPNPVIRTGYAKLHQPDGHLYAGGFVAPRVPSPRTKCETPGCKTAAQPWLTYLPP